MKVPTSKHYPEGRKFSLFLVDRVSGEVLVGFDNHKPKGPHIHRGACEEPYEYSGEGVLIEDFWRLVKEEGFLI